jgi:serine protease
MFWSESRMKFQPRRHRVAAASLGALLASTLPVGARAGSAGDAGFTVAEARRAKITATATTNRMIVKYRDAAAATVVDDVSAKASAARAGTQLKPLRIMGSGAHVMSLDRRMPVADVQRIAADLMASDANVEYAEPDRVMRPLRTPNDTRFNLQWHYSEATAGINAPAAWEIATGKGIVVAVIDTGVLKHRDLAANLVDGFDFISDPDVAGDGGGRDSDPTDTGDFTATNECGSGTAATSSSWHGTHVSGTIAAVTNNSQDVAGIAFDAKVQMLRALGRCGGFTSDIADAMRWAAGGTVNGVPANATPARVINLSLGGEGDCDNTSQAAINAARSLGTVVVVAAGNEAKDVSTSSPANCSGVIAVAAVGRTGARASYSNFGTGITLAAPGGDGTDGVISTVNAGRTVATTDALSAFQGTSMAAPHVAGVAALMLSINAALKPDEVAAILKSTARAFPAPCPQCGAGLLDANAAVVAALAASPPPAAVSPTPSPAPASSNDDGGGALGPAWLAALLAAVAAAFSLHRSASRRAQRVPARIRRAPPPR